MFLDPSNTRVQMAHRLFEFLDEHTVQSAVRCAVSIWQIGLELEHGMRTWNGHVEWERGMGTWNGNVEWRHGMGTWII